MRTLTVKLPSGSSWEIRHEAISDALARSEAAWSAQYQHLPIPVRFRACGALRAWNLACEQSPLLARAKRVMSDPSTTTLDAFLKFGGVIAEYAKLNGSREEAANHMRGMLTTISIMLTFWWRNGTLYEPTLALSTLLDGSDIEPDLPAHMLVAPSHTVCLVPPAGHRARCAGARELMLLEHVSEVGRGLTILCSRTTASGNAAFEVVDIKLEDGNTPLLASVDAFIEERRSRHNYGIADTAEELHLQWQGRLDYLVKALLYVRCEGTQLQHLSPYTNAPKVFPGLGRRKREERLSELELLYDRYIVGPESLVFHVERDDGEPLTLGHELPPHWRRGHFRSQPHGPQSSLRKLIFLAPTVVRADKLQSA